MKRTLGMLILAALVTAATPTPFGGWAVVTVANLPEYLLAGQSTTLDFEIRQHGVTLRDDVSPTVTLRRPDTGFLARVLGRERYAATRIPRSATYRVAIVPEDTGEVVIEIDTDVHGWKVQLLPLRVVAAGREPGPLALPDRGRQLFVAKGCATCHARRDDPLLAAWQVASVAPALTGRAFPSEWLAQKIATPARFRPATNSRMRMPALGLTQEEIAAIVSFLNKEELAEATPAEP